MRQLLSLLICSTATFSLVCGCSSQQEVPRDLPVTDEKPGPTPQQVVAPAKQQKEVFVFQAKYYQTKGPCIRVGDALVMPAIDAFEVTKKVQGEFKPKHVLVRALTGGGPRYPKELVVEKVYTLRLTPSERTRQQLRENENEGYSYVAIDGDEIEELGKESIIAAKPGAPDD
jgi:hypothetical protein